MKSLTPFLMYEGRAEEAITFYTDVFEDVEILFINRFGAETKGFEGKVMQALVRIQQQNIMMSDSSLPHEFTFTPSMSFFIECESLEQQEKFYNKIKSKGAILMPMDDYGFSKQFAWVVDPFGVSWQLNFSA